MISVQDIQQRWHDFFFAPCSVLPIALYRILFGGLVLGYGALLWPDLLVWFGEHGVLSRATALQYLGAPRLNPLLWLPAGDAWVRGVFAIFMGAALGLTCGCATRLCSILVFIGLVSFHHRNPLILNSGDTFLRCAAFFLIFAPAGAALSFDRLWRILRGRESSAPPLHPPWAQRLLQYQLAVVYLSTFLWKAQGATWLDGSALYYTSRLTEFQRFPVPYIFEHRWTILASTWGTLVVEFALGALVWIREWRYWILASGVVLHAGIEYSMNIPLFAFIMTTAYVTFVDGTDLQRVAQWLRRRCCGQQTQRPVFYDGHCVFCTRTVQFLAALDVGRRLQLIDFRTPNLLAQWPTLDLARADRELLIVTSSGKWLGGFFALRYLVWSLPLLWITGPFWYLPGMRWVGPRAYDWVARHRYLFMGRCDDGVCQRHGY